MKNDLVNCRSYQQGDKQYITTIHQCESFGSGCSIVKKSILSNLKFNLGYELSFGEDSDFGMQIRNKGYDILYLPEPAILHLKAPIGGFRSILNLAWNSEDIQPIPCPTITLFYLLHKTQEQIKGYKIYLFLKNYNYKTIKCPFKYLKQMKIKWDKSIYWANQLNKFR